MYQTLLTNYGQAALATAIATAGSVQLTQLAVGDGNGSAPTPSTAQTALVHENYRVTLNSLTVDTVNNYVIAEGVIPSAVGGFTIREAGIYDNSGNLFAVCNFPDTIKPIISDGSVRDLTIRFVMQVSNTANVTLLIDPSVVLASQSWVNNQAFLQKSGGTLTGPVIANADPAVPLGLATKQYVDSRSGVDSVPIGAIVWYPLTSAPASFLECDGSAISRTAYSALFSKIGTTFGVGNGSTTFNLPDLRGRFARGWDHGANRDVSIFTGNQTNLSTTVSGLSSTATMFVGQSVTGTNIPGGTTIASITNGTTIVLSAAATATLTANPLTFTGRAFGSTQDDAFESHAHRYATLANIVNGGSPTTAALVDWEYGGSAVQGPGNVEPLGNAETRPTNVALLPCIKASLLSNVDIALINAAITLYVAKGGDTMTGPLVLSGAPTLNLHAVTKLYADTLFAGAQPALGFTPVNRAGDTMTGALTLPGAPSATLHAATKQYVDTADALKVALADFTGSNQSLAASGYQKLPGGLILQWGTGTMAAGGTSSLSVTFPVAFPSLCVIAKGVFEMPSQLSYEVTTSVRSNSGATFYYGTTVPSTFTVKWFAIGY